jgi:hypothetical protein
MNGQRTHISSGREFSFTAGPDDELRCAMEGTVMEVRPMYIGGKEVCAETRLFLADGSARKDGLPVMSVTRLETSLKLAADRWFLLGLVPHPRGGTSSKEALVILIRGKPGHRPTPPLGQTEARNQRVLDRLKSKQVDVDWARTDLREAVAYLREVAGVDIVVHPETWSELAGEDRLVTQEMKQASLEKALQSLTAPRGLGFWVRHGAVFLGPEDMAHRIRAEFRAFPVHDLLFASPPGFTGEGGSYELHWVAPDEDTDLFEPLDGELLETFVRECVFPETWDRGPSSNNSK